MHKEFFLYRQRNGGDKEKENRRNWGVTNLRFYVVPLYCHTIYSKRGQKLFYLQIVILLMKCASKTIIKCN